MADKLSDINLRRLRKYIADETKRLGRCGGKVLRVNLDEVEEDSTCGFPAKPSDPLERDLDALFGPDVKQKRPEA